MQPRLFHLHTLSALHCGAGQSADVVDVPIARARATRLPMVPGSSLRGVLREQISGGDEHTARTLFGPRSITSSEDSFAGALTIGDAHLLALPVRCLAGIVSYVTSPFILRRYQRDRDRAGIATPALPADPVSGEATVTSDINCLKDTEDKKKLVLEDLDLTARKDDSLPPWAKQIARTLYPDDIQSQSDFVRRFALLSDDIMDFLAETATEVRARIRIDENTGTVAKGALWYEEHLPAETVMWGVYALSASNRHDDKRGADELVQALPATGTLLQLGGKAGVGHGLARFMTNHAGEQTA